MIIRRGGWPGESDGRSAWILYCVPGLETRMSGDEEERCCGDGDMEGGISKTSRLLCRDGALDAPPSGGFKIAWTPIERGCVGSGRGSMDGGGCHERGLLEPVSQDLGAADVSGAWDAAAGADCSIPLRSGDCCCSSFLGPLGGGPDTVGVSDIGSRSSSSSRHGRGPTHGRLLPLSS